MADKPEKIHDLRKRYLKALIDGNGQQARLLVDEALSVSGSPFEIYLDLLAPVQIELGSLWQKGKIDIAQEHWATETTLSMMEQLKRAADPRPAMGHSAVVTSIEGDRHTVGARMVAHFLQFDGWDVDFLGADTPIGDLTQFIGRTEPDLIAISITLPEGLAQLSVAVEKIRQLPREVHILVGGAAIESDEFKKFASTLNIDGVAHDALEAIQTARALVGEDGRSQSLEIFLQRVGQKIQRERKSKGWSQQKLGDLAGLDRTYISAVEHGKQNLTLGALKRVADALDISMESLLAADKIG